MPLILPAPVNAPAPQEQPQPSEAMGPPPPKKSANIPPQGRRKGWIPRSQADLIGDWPTLVQTVIYIVLGLIWLLPLRRFLIWMETGRWG